MDSNHQILGELIYERAKLQVKLRDLLLFDEDLAHSIERALEMCAASKAEQAQLADKLVLRAWRRLGDEVESPATVVSAMLSA